MIGFTTEPYTDDVKAWLQNSSHYLGRSPPGCMYAVGVRLLVGGLWGLVPCGELVGLCLVGRPVARMLPQDGSVGEITRMWLRPGLPHGTASALLRAAADVGRSRGVRSLISYHDRTRHTGCIYRKAGFRKDGATTPPTGKGWASHPRTAKSGDDARTSKRRWRLDL